MLYKTIWRLTITPHIFIQDCPNLASMLSDSTAKYSYISFCYNLFLFWLSWQRTILEWQVGMKKLPNILTKEKKHFVDALIKPRGPELKVSVLFTEFFMACRVLIPSYKMQPPMRDLHLTLPSHPILRAEIRTYAGSTWSWPRNSKFQSPAVYCRCPPRNTWLLWPRSLTGSLRSDLETQIVAVH